MAGDGADLVLRNARVVGGDLVDVTCAGGLITAVEPSGPATLAGAGDAARTVDLGGALLLPAMVEPHAHLDKALTADIVANEDGDLAGAIAAWQAHYAGLTIDDVTARATAAVRRLVAAGCTTIRTHVDVGADVGTLGVEALMATRQAVRDLVDLEIVALVTCPVTGPEGAANRAALSAAIDVGVDLIGGCPHIDPSPAELIDLVLDASRDAGRPVDLHVDETLDPAACSLETLAHAVLDRGHPHPVTASHCVSLGVQAPEVQDRVAASVADAGIAIVTLPQTNLFLQARDRRQSPPRGLTAIDALLAAGVPVAAGGDNFQDPFCTVGRVDPLETASLLVMAAHRRPDFAFDMVSEAGRRVLGRPVVTVEPGAPADLVAIDASSVRDAVASAPVSRTVVRAGRVVAVTTVQTTILP